MYSDYDEEGQKQNAQQKQQRESRYGANGGGNPPEVPAEVTHLIESYDMLQDLTKVSGRGVYCCDFLLLPITSYYS